MSPKMAEAVDGLPASCSEQHLPGCEFGEDSWRGGRRLVNLQLCRSPLWSPSWPSIWRLFSPDPSSGCLWDTFVGTSRRSHGAILTSVNALPPSTCRLIKTYASVK